MARRFRNIALFVVGGLLLANTSGAFVCPAHSTVPLYVKVGGKQTTNPALPHASIAYTVAIRDFANNPIAGMQIMINFQNCPDTRLCSFSLGAQTVDCTGRFVTGTTNAVGQVTFSILGAGTNSAPPVPPIVAPGAGAGCVRIFADQCAQLGVATAVIYDQDGAVPPLGVGPSFRNGVKGSDLPIVITEIGAGNAGAPYRGRSDYSTDGSVNGLDLSAFLTILGESNGGTGSGNGCSDNSAVAVPYCP